MLKMIVMTMLLLFASITNAQDSYTPQERTTQKIAQQALESRKNLEALNSPELAQAFAQAHRDSLIANADSTWEQGVHDFSSSITQLWNLVTGDSEAAAQQARADELYHSVNPSSERAQKLGEFLVWLVFVVSIIVFIISMNKVKRGQSGVDMASDALDAVKSIQNNVDLKSANFYAIAEEEYENGEIDKGLWSQALVKANGNESLRKVEYMKLRVMQLKQKS
jgi:hypothetical protein